MLIHYTLFAILNLSHSTSLSFTLPIYPISPQIHRAPLNHHLPHIVNIPSHSPHTIEITLAFWLFLAQSRWPLCFLNTLHSTGFQGKFIYTGSQTSGVIYVPRTPVIRTRRTFIGIRPVPIICRLMQLAPPSGKTGNCGKHLTIDTLLAFNIEDKQSCLFPREFHQAEIAAAGISIWVMFAFCQQTDFASRPQLAV